MRALVSLENAFIWLFPNVSQSEKQSIWGVIEQITVAVLLDPIRRMTCGVLKKWHYHIHQIGEKK